MNEVQSIVQFNPMTVLKGHKAPVYVAKFNKDG
jgi:hypothetical protein